ncbi:MAG: M61 family metallopeptidase [Polyangiales bacterium]
MAVRHKVSIADANAHLVTVHSTFTATPGAVLPDPLVVAMPVWTPGSYLVREYARCVELPRATASDGRALQPEKIRKNAWAIHHGGVTEVTFAYELYCNDLSVRTNHVDATHLLLNGAAAFTFAAHAPSEGAEVVLDLPEGWKIETSLKRADGTLRASSFDELCDAPIHAGQHRLEEFEAAGKRHAFAIWGDPIAMDWNDVVRDTKLLVETEAKLLSGLPHDGYSFLWMITPKNRGGLEHRDSCALTVPASAFDDRKGYLDVLSLVAHEYLHLWNVKRIRPAGLTPYRYEEENYTKLLWWFEGATSYFDWRILRLSGIATADEYLEHLSEEMARLEDTPGRMQQSASEASFDAWIKLYRSDENTVNSTVSYYLKGEIVCAMLDLEIRSRTNGERGLDHVLQELWRVYGLEEKPVPEDGMALVLERVSGSSMRELLDAWVNGREELPTSEIFAKVGLEIVRDANGRRGRGSLGIRLRALESSNGRAIVTSVLRGRAAHKAGLDAGDEIVAIGGRRIEGGKLDGALVGKTAGTKIEVVISREGKMRTIEAVLDPPPNDRLRLRMIEKATAAQKALLQGWLQGMPNTRASDPGPRSNR